MSPGDDHAHHAQLEEALDHPVGDLLLLVDLDGRVLVAHIGVQLRQQLIASGDLLGAHLRVGEDQLLAEVAPEDVLDEAHGGGIGPQHLLGLLDLLAILLGDVLELFGEVGLGHDEFSCF